MCIGFRFAEIQSGRSCTRSYSASRWSVRKGYTMPVQQSPISKPKDGLPVTLKRWRDR